MPPIALLGQTRQNSGRTINISTCPPYVSKMRLKSKNSRNGCFLASHNQPISRLKNHRIAFLKKASCHFHQLKHAVKLRKTENLNLSVSCIKTMAEILKRTKRYSGTTSTPEVSNYGRKLPRIVFIKSSLKQQASPIC